MLDVLPSPRQAVYGGNGTASWGGNTVFFNGSYHLFVSEMTQGCGLLDWLTNTQIVHAVAQSPEGPFTKRDVAIKAMSTNPQVQHHCTVTAPSLHRHCTVTAPSPHPSLHHH